MWPTPARAIFPFATTDALELVLTLLNTRSARYLPFGATSIRSRPFCFQSSSVHYPTPMAAPGSCLAVLSGTESRHDLTDDDLGAPMSQVVAGQFDIMQ